MIKNILNQYNQHSGTTKSDTSTAVNDYGACYYGTFDIPITEIAFASFNQPARKKDDKGHITILSNDIKSVGLQIAPIVVWEPITKKWTSITGGHRLKALEKLEEKIVPCSVVSFSDPNKQYDFCFASNSHRPSKPSSGEDIKLYFEKLKYPSNILTTSDKKDYALQKCKKIFPSFSGKTFDRMWKEYESTFNFGLPATIHLSDANKAALAHFKLSGTFKAGQQVNNSFYFCSEPTALDKSIGIALNKKFILDKQKEKHDWHILSYSDSYKYNSVCQERTRMLKNYAKLNRLLYIPNNIVIEDIAFIQQLRDNSGKPETMKQYIWQNNDWFSLRENKYMGY